MQLVHQIVAAIRFVFKKSCSTVLQVLLNKIFDYDTKCVKMHKSRRKNCRMLIYTNCLGLCYNKKGYYRENNLLKGGIVMNEAQYDYKDICNYIIARAEKSKHSVTNLQLQKILYYVQGYFCVSLKFRLLTLRLKHGSMVRWFRKLIMISAFMAGIILQVKTLIMHWAKLNPRNTKTY